MSGGKLYSALLRVHRLGSSELTVTNLAQVGNARPTQMIKLLGQMLKLPVAAFVASLELITRAMRDLQRTFEESVEVLASGATEALTPQATAAEVRPQGEKNSNSEDVHMPDQDLSGDDLKYVAYSIVFTKRDFEATLRRQENELVNYPTDGGSFGGLKISHFMRDVLAGRVPRPPEWTGPNNYPPGETRAYGWSFVQEDERYIQFVYEVTQRIAKQDADYDRRQARALEAIRDRL